MISAHRLIFNGFSTEDFDLVPYLSFDEDSGATPTFLSAEGVYTEHYDGHRTIHRAKYNEAFTPRFTLIKKDESDFDATENRKILSWITASEKPGFLEVYKDDSNVLEWQIFGCITSVEQYKLGNGRIVGYEFEMESSHPYAWSRKMEITKEINIPTPLTITNNSDEYLKPIYPTVTIKFSDTNIYLPIVDDPMSNNYVMIPNVIYKWNDGYYINLVSEGQKIKLPDPAISMEGTIASGDSLDKYYYFIQDGVIAKGIKTNDNKYAWQIITEVGVAIQIENKTMGISTIVTGAAIGETIILDGANKVISSYIKVNGALVQNTKIIGNHFNWKWLPLSYGENNIVVTGNCEIKIEWLEPRKVGNL